MRRELEDLDELEEELEAFEESREDSQPYNQPSYEPTTIRKSSSVVVMFRGTVVSAFCAVLGVSAHSVHQPISA